MELQQQSSGMDPGEGAVHATPSEESSQTPSLSKVKPLDQADRRLKVVTDSTRRPKPRFRALCALLQTENELSRRTFFRRHKNTIFDILYPAFIWKASKIRASRVQRTDSKELAELLRITLHVKWFLVLVPEAVRAGTWNTAIESILKALLVRGNDHMLRLEGLRIMLSFINALCHERVEISELYTFAFAYEAFLLSGSASCRPGRVVGLPLSDPPIIPSRSPPSIAEAVETFEEMLHGILALAYAASSSPAHDFERPELIPVGVGVERAMEQASFMAGLFSRRTLAYLFPRVAAERGMVLPDAAPRFQTCPPCILEKLIRFGSRIMGGKTPGSAAEAILKPIIFGDPHFRAFLEESIRQTLDLPCADVETKNQAIRLLVSWVCTPSADSLEYPRRKNACAVVRRYTGMVASAFGTDVPQLDQGCYVKDKYIDICQDVLLFFRAVSTETGVELDEVTWSFLLSTLLRIKDEILQRVVSHCPHDLHDEGVCQTLPSLLFETMFVMWVRSRTQDRLLWIKLRDVVLANWRIDCIIDEWIAIVGKLCAVYTRVVCGVKPNPVKFSKRRLKQAGALISLSSSTAGTGTFEAAEAPVPHCSAEAQGQCRDFSSLSSISWSSERACRATRNILGLMVSVVGRIEDPVKHHKVLMTLVSVWDSWRSNWSFLSEGSLRMLIRGSVWMLQSTRLAKDYWRSRQIGFRELVKTLRGIERPFLSRECLQMANQTIAMGLQSDDGQVTSRILEGIGEVFTANGFTGSGALVDPVIRVVKRIFSATPQDYHHTDPQEKYNALMVLATLVPYPRLLRQSGMVTGHTYARLSGLKNDILSVCSSVLLAEDPSTGSGCLCRTAICIINSLFFEDMLNQGRSDSMDFDVLRSCAMKLDSGLRHANREVARCATLCFATIGHNWKVLVEGKPGAEAVLHEMIDSYVAAVQQRLSDGDREDIVIQQIYSLCEWLEFIGHLGTERSNVHLELLLMLERCLQYRQKSDRKRDPSTNRRGPILSVGEPTIPRAAENVFLFVSKGMSDGSDWQTELARSRIHEYRHSDIALFVTRVGGIISISRAADPAIRIMYRDRTGKYAWDTQTVKNVLRRSSSSDLGESASPEGTGRQRLPLSDTVENTESYDTHRDAFDSMVHSLYSEGIINRDELFDGAFCEDFEGRSEYLEETSRMARAAAAQFDEESTKFQSDIGISMAENRRQYDVSDAFDRQRLVGGFGMMLLGSSDDEPWMHGLEPCPSLWKDVEYLDKLPCKDLIKAGLLYVGYRQTSEHDIFSNSRGSEEYEAFVSSLGWDVNLETHDGYCGGLRGHQLEGATTLYWCNLTVEMVFHECTRLKTSPDDDKHLSKKRHIGNDSVHVVWNESGAPYNLDTIVGDYGDVQIVVTPLNHGDLFRLEMHGNEHIRKVSPLVSNATVSKPCLAPLVRSAAILGFKAATESTLKQQLPHPYDLRAQEIANIVSRYSQSRDGSRGMESFLSALLGFPG